VQMSRVSQGVLAISESRNWSLNMDLDRQWTWNGRLGDGPNEARPNVGLGQFADAHRLPPGLFKLWEQPSESTRIGRGIVF
jgi:hypothetical protein